MKLSRRHQVLPSYGYCREPDCRWHQAGPGAETCAADHTTRTDHETRVVTTRETIISPVPQRAVSDA